VFKYSTNSSLNTVFFSFYDIFLVYTDKHKYTQMLFREPRAYSQVHSEWGQFYWTKWGDRGPVGGGMALRGVLWNVAQCERPSQITFSAEEGEGWWPTQLSPIVNPCIEIHLSKKWDQSREEQEPSTWKHFWNQNLARKIIAIKAA